MYIFKAAADASKAAMFLLKRAGGSEEMTEGSDGTQSDKTDDVAGNQDGNQQE